MSKPGQAGPKTQQTINFIDNWPSFEIATKACRQSWVLVRAIKMRCCTFWVKHYWWSSFEVWGPFLLRRKRPQWSPYGQHLTGRARQDHYSSFFAKGGVHGVLPFYLVQTFLVNTIYSLRFQRWMPERTSAASSWRSEQKSCTHFCFTSLNKNNTTTFKWT